MNCIKTSIEDTFARTFNFFKSELQKKFSFLKNIIKRNYPNNNLQASLIDNKSVVNNSKNSKHYKRLDFNESLIDFIVERENSQDKSNGKIKK